MISFPVEVLSIGFSHSQPIENAILLLGEYQDTFDFVLVKEDDLESYQPIKFNSFSADEIYNLMDSFFLEVGGVHTFSIAMVDKRLDENNYRNLFSSMQVNKNGRLTGQAISSSFYVNEIIEPIPIETYHIIQLLCFSIQFVVGRKMIHKREQDRYCLFHNKIQKRDMLEVIKEGYISRESQRQINKYLNVKQRTSFMNILEFIKEIAASDEPHNFLNDHLSRISISNPVKLRKVLNTLVFPNRESNSG